MFLCLILSVLHLIPNFGKLSSIFLKTNFILIPIFLHIFNSNSFIEKCLEYLSVYIFYPSYSKVNILTFLEIK